MLNWLHYIIWRLREHICATPRFDPMYREISELYLAVHALRKHLRRGPGKSVLADAEPVLYYTLIGLEHDRIPYSDPPVFGHKYDDPVENYLRNMRAYYPEIEYLFLCLYRAVESIRSIAEEAPHNTPGKADALVYSRAIRERVDHVW